MLLSLIVPVLLFGAQYRYIIEDKLPSFLRRRTAVNHNISSLGRRQINFNLVNKSIRSFLYYEEKTKLKTVKNFANKMSVALKFTYFDPIFSDNLQSNSRIMSITGYDTNCV